MNSKKVVLELLQIYSEFTPKTVFEIVKLFSTNFGMIGMFFKHFVAILQKKN